MQQLPLIQIVIVLVVIGVILGLINRYIPMASSIKSLLNGVVIICTVLWLLVQFNVIHSLGGLRLPH